MTPASQNAYVAAVKYRQDTEFAMKQYRLNSAATYRSEKESLPMTILYGFVTLNFEG
jgi:hypothetical protein